MTGREVLSRSSWRDNATGVEEHAKFLDSPDGTIMVHLHLPGGGSDAGVVVCSPTDREQMRHYRRETLIGRRLAEAGIAVVRFEYRGTGNSDPIGFPRSLDTMEQDISTVAAWFLGSTGVTSIGFLAESLSALPAARVVAQYPGAPLALLEPVIRPESFYRRLQRTRLVAEARDGGAEWPLRRSLAETLAADGWADILGYRLDAPAYDAAITRDLRADVGDTARPVLILQVDKKEGLRNELADLAEVLRQRELSVKSLVIRTEHAWWYIPEWEPDIADEENAELIPGLAGWFREAFGLRFEVANG